MKKNTKKQEKILIENLSFLSSLNESQRSYVLSLMMNGQYEICPNKLIALSKEQ